MTICLPAAIAARACRMPTAGLPVASTTTSIAPPAIARAPSSVKAVRAIRAASQPTVRQASRARSRIEIDDDGHLEPRRVRHLRQEHRAEFAGADQRDANRLAGRVAGVEEAMRGSWENDPIELSVSRTRCSVCSAAPQSRDPLIAAIERRRPAQQRIGA